MKQEGNSARTPIWLYVLTAAAPAGGALVVLLQANFLQLGSAGIATLWWVVASALTTLAACTAIGQWWMLAERRALSTPASAIPGVVKSACVVGATIVAAFAVACAGMATTMHDVAVALAEYDDYKVEYDARTKAVRVSGTIGIGFSDLLVATLTAHPDARTVVIESVGGLLDEALLAASALEPRKLDIVVDQYCHSACLAVFAAGAKRYARYDAAFGFHAASPVMSGNPFAQRQVQKDAHKFDEYLISRGAPRTGIEAANRLGPADMHFVSAIELTEQQFVMHVFDGADYRAAISLQRAKWRQARDLIEEDYPALIALLNELEKAAPKVVERFSDGLVETDSEDTNTVVEALFDFLNERRRSAIGAAHDVAVLTFALARQRGLDALAAKEDWSACAAFSSDPMTADALEPAQRIELTAAWAGLIQSAQRRGWQVVPLPRAAARFHANIATEAQLTTLSASAGNLEEKACLKSAQFFKLANARSPAQAATILRYDAQVEVLNR